ncbi:ATP-dependent DNA ligase [Nocardia salmonicida]|uniref:ATP-dependent DNA ligase n=1 Tax=Nocardia salmonicida TaxID=53431 RepID=UPI003640A7FB
MKWDGVRAIAHCTQTGINLWSRNLREISGSYPEIVIALTEITDGRTMLLADAHGAPDAHGGPSFSRLQRRMHVRRLSATRSTNPAAAPLPGRKWSWGSRPRP